MKFCKHRSGCGRCPRLRGTRRWGGWFLYDALVHLDAPDTCRIGTVPWVRRTVISVGEEAGACEVGGGGEGSATHRVKHERVREAGSAFSPGARFLSPTVGAVPGRGHRGEAGEEATGGDRPLRAARVTPGAAGALHDGGPAGVGSPHGGFEKEVPVWFSSRPYTAVCICVCRRCM